MLPMKAFMVLGAVRMANERRGTSEQEGPSARESRPSG